MPFTPKFVDLVRNFTTVQGTGQVTLGAAVSGYASIAEALQAGDRFYYCLQGVDKPQEREVGRGTLQADGKVTREPVSGSLTSFTGGTKTIALVAAAEWFSKLELGGGSSIEAATRDAMAAAPAGRGPLLLTEAGREGLFVFDPIDHSAEVAADPRQAVYVPAQSDATGGEGAWVRSFSGALDVRWFGAAGDDIANDGPAFAAAIAFCKSLARPGYGYGQGSPKLFVPSGRYFLGTTTLELTHTLIIEGENGGGFAGGGTVLRWTAGTTGIRTQSYNTSGATGGAFVTSHLGAAGFIIRNLMLVGGFTDTEAEAHGIHMRVKGAIRDVFISGFEGDGVRCAAQVGSGSMEGNCNGSIIENVGVAGCREGFSFEGADTNAIQLINPTVNSVRRHGIVSKDNIGLNIWGGDSSTSGMGHVLATPAYNKASHGGKWYFVIAGQEAWASANPPSGTTAPNQGWGYMPGPGTVAAEFPAWSGGMNLRAAYPVWVEGGSAYNSVVGFYSEGDQPPSMISGHTRWDCPMAPAVHTDGEFYGGQVSPNAAGFSVPRNFRVGSAGDVWGVRPGACALHVDGDAYLTRSNSVAYDPTLHINTTQAYATIAFERQDAIYGQIQLYSGGGFYSMLTNAGHKHHYYVGGSLIADIDSAGLNLAAGKVLKVGGTTTLSGQMAAQTDSAASDLTGLKSDFNALLAKLRSVCLLAS